MKTLFDCQYCGADSRKVVGFCCDLMKRDVEAIEIAFWGTDEERAKQMGPSLRYWITPDPDYQI